MNEDEKVVERRGKRKRGREREREVTGKQTRPRTVCTCVICPRWNQVEQIESRQHPHSTVLPVALIRSLLHHRGETELSACLDATHGLFRHCFAGALSAPRIPCFSRANTSRRAAVLYSCIFVPFRESNNNTLEIYTHCDEQLRKNVALARVRTKEIGNILRIFCREY